MVRALLLLGLASAPAGAITLTRTRPEQESFRQELYNFKDLQYYANISVGGQTVNCVLDTGSVEFVVMSDRCASWCGAKDKLFHPFSSASYSSGSGSQVLSYGSGQLSATEAWETVAIGPMQMKTPFWEIVDASMPLLLESDFQAIIGMGPVQLNLEEEEDASNERRSERSSVNLPQRMDIHRFGICMGRGSGSSGWFTWNDDSVTHINMRRLQVPWTGYWMVKIQDIRIGDTVIGCPEGCGAVIDSGTSLLAMPGESSELLEGAVGGLHEDCHDLHMLPDIRFRLGPGQGVPYSLPSDSYVGEVVGETTARMSRHFKRKNKSRCEVAVMTVEMEQPEMGEVWILGVPFLRKYYSVFTQATREDPVPSIYTAVADTRCKPSSSAVEGLIMERGHKARTIDASALRIPSWARAGSRPVLHTEDAKEDAKGEQSKDKQQNVIVGRQFVDAAEGGAEPRLHH